uniref:Calcineurin-like phosphoesterase domain-containing protein n=1 Tax=Timema bartmani TaxID=61472 RepID=A0A7R9EN17_9NEOP|nr:unnamed protein product [Timema bartmani]
MLFGCPSAGGPRDLFDEGLWCSEKEFKYYVQRFHDLFAVPEGTELYVVVGNHDVGFHYGISRCTESLMQTVTSQIKPQKI